MSSSTYDIKWHYPGDEIQRDLHRRAKHLLKCEAAEGRRRTKAWLREPTGPLKHSMLLASVGSLHRRENTSSKRLGNPPYPEHWIIFSFSYSNQVHMSSACCAAGVLTVLPVSFNVVVNHTSHISSQISARTDLSYHAHILSIHFWCKHAN